MLTVIAGFSVISLYRGTCLSSVGASSPPCSLFWRRDRISRSRPASRRARKPRCASASSRNCHHPHSEVSRYEQVQTQPSNLFFCPQKVISISPIKVPSHATHLILDNKQQWASFEEMRGFLRVFPVLHVASLCLRRCETRINSPLSFSPSNTQPLSLRSPGPVHLPFLPTLSCLHTLPH